MTVPVLQYEGEFEDEFEDEDEWEDESFSLGGLVNGLSGLLGESEEEDEDENEWEDESFSLGGLVNGLSGLLGESEDEWEGEYEDEAEEFFKGIGKFLKRAAPILRTIAKAAGPLVATAVGGPAAGALAGKLTSMLEGEGEFEAEWEAEFENVVSSPLTASQSLAEVLAARAASAATEGEAEALAGAAAVAALSPHHRAELRELLPQMVRGIGLMSRLLYGNAEARPAMRMLPTIADQTANDISRRIESGQRVGSAAAGRIMGREVVRVLGNPRHGARAMHRHYRGVKTANRSHGGASTARHRGRRHVATGRLTSSTPAGRPRPGTMRVVTPVRIPSPGGGPARRMNVVTDVRMPRGAVPAARAAVVPPRRRGH